MDSTDKNMLASLQSAVSCVTIFAISYHVINQRFLHGGFAGDQRLHEGGWTLSLVILTLLSAIYFISAVSVLILELKPHIEIKRKQLLKKILNLQGCVALCLFVISPESAAVFAALSLSRVRKFYPLKVALYILFFIVLTFVISVSFYYGKTLGAVGIVIVTVLAAGFYIFTLIHSHNAVREKELRQQTADLNRELLATRELLAQSSRQSERLRIARNIHDMLGHQLTGLILNLEVAGHISQGEVQSRVKQSLSLAKSLLGELRDAVSELRESAAFDFNQALRNIVSNISELEISLSIEERLVIENAITAETLIRCIQESLTNVRRHANATLCFIRLYRKEGEIVLYINDNGSVKNAIAAGNGLNGMRERINALSGKLHWGETGGSFFLEAILPVAVL